MRYATFAKRLAAYFLDALIGGVVIAGPINLLVFGFAVERRPGPDEIDIVLFQILMVVGVVATFVYLGFMEGKRYQATPGELIRDTKHTRAWGEGR